MNSPMPYVRAVLVSSLVLMLLASVVPAGEPRVPREGAPRRATFTLECPEWEIILDAAGYCDAWYLKQVPGWYCVEDAHEVLSGEWAAAIYYDGIENSGYDASAPDGSAVWLPQVFILPTWATNSSFEEISIHASDNGSNPSGNGTNDTAESVIANHQVTIKIDYEIADLEYVFATPMGISPDPATGKFVRSSRYVLLQTYTITNDTDTTLENLEFYQMLHGQPGDEYAAVVTTVYDSTDYTDGFLDGYTPWNSVHATGDYRYDITQWNDPADPEAHSDYVDWIGFSSSVEPETHGNSRFAGVFSKPVAPGTHWDIEARNLNELSSSEGEVAGAQMWELGDLDAGNSVSVTVALMTGQADCNDNDVSDICDIAGAGIGFEQDTSWSAYDPGENGVGTDPDAYTGAAFDGRYVYFAPSGEPAHGEVLRYDTTGDFVTSGSWDTCDPAGAGVGDDPVGFHDALVVGNYVYFVPNGDSGSASGEVLRFHTTGTFNNAADWEAYDPGAHGVGTDPAGYRGAVYDGRYIYFVPFRNGAGHHGEVLRYDTTMPFSIAMSWATFDAAGAGVGDNPVGFVGAVYDYWRRYVYFVPGTRAGGEHGEVLRYDTDLDFDDADSWSAFDPGAAGVGSDPDGYAGAVFDGRYIYFAPRHNGTGAHGEVLRYDTNRFFDQALAWDTFDPGTAGVGTDPDGFYGVVFDERFVYFVPFHNGSEYHGEVLRYDVEGEFDDVASWNAYDPGAHGVGTDPDGYQGAVVAEQYIYFAPLYQGASYHGEVLRYDRAGGWYPDWNENGIPDVCDYGACCDDDAGTCDDDVHLDDCPPPARFARATDCADLEPACGEGACCYDGSCAEQSEADCGTGNGVWLGPISCTPDPCWPTADPCGGTDALFDNGMPDGEGVMRCDRGIGFAIWVVDDLTFPADVTIEEVHWWTMNDVGFNWAALADLIILAADGPGGEPGTVLHEFYSLPSLRYDTTETYHNQPVYLNLIEGLSLSLPAGDYWLGVRPVEGEAMDAYSFWLSSPLAEKEAMIGHVGAWYPGSGVYGVARDVAFCVTGVCCPINLLFTSDPPTGALDVRKPHPADSDALKPWYGIGMPDDPGTPAKNEWSPITIDLGVAGATRSCFELCESPSQTTPNRIHGFVDNLDGTYTITLRHGIAAGAVTTVRYLGGTGMDYTEYLHHPGNIDGSSTANANDIIVLIDQLNDTLGGGVTYPLYQVDTDYSSRFTANDIIELIDLLNGAGRYRSWIESELPVNDGCP